MIKLKGIYLVKRWTELDYEIAAYGLLEDGKVIEGLSLEFRNQTRDLHNAKVEALESLMEHNDEIDFDIQNVFSGRIKAYNKDGSKIKLVYKDIRGGDIRGGYPTSKLVRFYLRDNKKNIYYNDEFEEDALID